MSGVSLPVTRPSGRALLVGAAPARSQVADALQRLGYASDEADHPYAAMAEFCRQPLAYSAVILSLAGLYREELPIIRAIKRRFPHVEVWLAHTDGRQAALAEAMRLGADGLLDEDGLHRVGVATTPDSAREPAYRRQAAEAAFETYRPRQTAPPVSADRSDPDDATEDSCEPILSADELRALLQEHPSMPANGDEPL
jgi:DNA-binding NarL/FixJ family response regulator